MHCDLNIPWSQEIHKTLHFLDLLKYDIVAINLSVSSSKQLKEILTKSFTPEVYENLKLKYKNLKILRRVTVLLEENQPNLANFAQVQLENETVHFDLVAAKPSTEKHLLNCATSLDIDLILIDCTKRLPFQLRHKTCGAAIQRGVKFEVTYSPSVLADKITQKNLISNAMVLFRVCRFRGCIVSSGALNAAGLRAPLDVVNLVRLWGLKTADEAVGGYGYEMATRGVLRHMSVKQAVLPSKRRKLA